MKDDRKGPPVSLPDDLADHQTKLAKLSVLDSNEGSGGWDPGKPIGKGNPPQRTSWKKGGPSPNPKGAPRRRSAGPYMTVLSRRIDGANLTYGEALDRKIRGLALQGDVRAAKLLHARLAREEEITKRRAEFERYERQRADHAMRRPDAFRAFEAGGLFVDFLDQMRPVC